MIDAKSLAEIVQRPSDAMSKWVEPLALTFDRFDISTPMRSAMFIAQCAHESARFALVEECLNYTADALMRVWPKRFDVKMAGLCAHHPARIASIAYSGRMGNGDEDSGDGWRYRGRGLIQLTGRNNYAECGPIIGADLLSDPDILLRPQFAALSAGWYWQNRGLNAPSDAGDIERVTKLINGGLHGLADRLTLYDRAKSVLGVK